MSSTAVPAIPEPCTPVLVWEQGAKGQAEPGEGGTAEDGASMGRVLG